MYTIFNAGSMLMQILRIAILIYCILTWFRPSSNLFYWLESFVSPFLAPFRKISYAIMRKTGIPIDLSCYFALIGISIVNRLWWFLYRLLSLTRF